jgi:serine/threonine-protein kinase
MRMSGAPERVGRYLVFEAFARGGMASVHMGRLIGDSGFSRIVAVKRLHPLYALSAEHYAMLLNEARLSSRVRHPNVVPTLDVVHEEEKLCLVMEYVRGASLSALVVAAKSAGERVPAPVAVAIVADALRGLHAAHEAKGEDGAPLGIVHRDVSPHNLLVGSDGVTRVLDFGVAKALRKEHLTKTGDVKGKVAYMSPEQLRGSPVTRQADIFAAGVVLWEVLAGDRLWGDDEPARIITRVLSERPPSLLSKAPEIPPALDSAIARALASSQRARFATAEEMALALTDACAPASHAEVARYLEYVAGSVLEQHAVLEREVEAYRGGEAAAVESARSNLISIPTLPPTSAPRPAELPTSPPSAGYRRAILLAAAVTLAAVVVAAAFRSRAAGRVAVAPAPETAATGPAEETIEIVDVPPSDTPPSSAPASAPTRAVPPKHAQPVPTAAARSAAGHTPSCDPPYSIDEHGRKHYRPECLP